VPQRIEEQNAAINEDNTGSPGVWGSWGPWSACSRSCSGGVMEQTRPCLPGYFYERSYHRPGQYPASERTLGHQLPPRQEDPLSPFSGHVISAIRTSMPLHRSEEPPRAELSSGGHNDSGGASRGGRLSQSWRRSPKAERRKVFCWCPGFLADPPRPAPVHRCSEAETHMTDAAGAGGAFPLDALARGRLHIVFFRHNTTPVSRSHVFMSNTCLLERGAHAAAASPADAWKPDLIKQL
ncbi:Thrombospondin type-1 domain-containing protein 4, partial [Varanus komodoensis]